MVNLIMKGFIVTVWLSVLSTEALEELEDVVYHRVLANESVDFSCDYPNPGHNLVAFTLKRGNPAKEVLYYNFRAEPIITDEQLKHRLSVRNEQASRTVILSVSPPRPDDSDLYTFVFHSDVPEGFKDHQGNKKVFLFVSGTCDEPACCKEIKCSYAEMSCEDKPCNHEPLVFALSAAAGLLFIVVVALGAAYLNNRSRESRPQPSVAIYEEMNGVRQKAALPPNEEDIRFLYAQPKKENPYCSSAP